MGLFPDHQSGVKTKPNKGPVEDPRYASKTASEVQALRTGIAPTANNMGSLAVQFRADEATAREGGGQSIGDKRDQKIIDTRAADRSKRLQNTQRATQAFKDRQDRAGHGQRSNTPRNPLNRTLKSAMAPTSGYGLF